MSSGWCRGFIKGDPDIAGTGVVTAIWIANGASLLAGSVLWYLTTCIANRTKTQENLFKRTLTSALALGDTALVTLLAIVSSSIFLINAKPETSLYHVFIARCLAQNCQNGLFCSVPYWDYRELAGQSKLGRLARNGLVLASTGLWLYWSWLCERAFDRETYRTPHCFYNSDAWIGGTYIFWIRLDYFWTPCGWAWYLLEPFKECEDMLKLINSYVPRFGRRLDRVLDEVGQSLRRIAVRSTTSIDPISELAYVFFCMAFVLVDAVLCLIVAVFVQPPFTAPFVNVLFFIWSAVDLALVWKHNKHIVIECPDSGGQLSKMGNVNPESDWGFGQLLPMFLLLLPILTVLDSIE